MLVKVKVKREELGLISRRQSKPCQVSLSTKAAEGERTSTRPRQK